MVYYFGPFYPSSDLLLPSFYPKAYHYVIWETEEKGIEFLFAGINTYP
jgi:hypothetical protein